MATDSEKSDGGRIAATVIPEPAGAGWYVVAAPYADVDGVAVLSPNWRRMRRYCYRYEDAATLCAQLQAVSRQPLAES